MQRQLNKPFVGGFPEKLKNLIFEISILSIWDKIRSSPWIWDLSHCKFTLQMFSYCNILMFYSLFILSPHLCFCTCLFLHSLSVIVLLLAHCNVILLTVPPFSPLSFLNPGKTEGFFLSDLDTNKASSHFSWWPS